MKKILVVVAALVAGYVFFSSQHVATLRDAPSPISEQRAGTSDATIANAFSNRESNLQVSGQGIVTKVLPDDTRGSRHQRFIVELSSGQTLLVTHNIDIAPRIDSLRVGDAVQFFGEYEWNQQGGVLHWTHRDTRGTHVAGWLRHQGKTYQ
jgi:Protein of unknown function (DUF3465)